MELTLIVGLLVGVVTLVYFFVLRQRDVAIPTYAPDTFSVVVKDKDGTCSSNCRTFCHPFLCALPFISGLILSILALILPMLQDLW